MSALPSPGRSPSLLQIQMNRLPGGANSTGARGPPPAVRPNTNNSGRGSTVQDPLLIDENGRIVEDLSEYFFFGLRNAERLDGVTVDRRLSPVKRSPSGRVLQIFQGPPSTINPGIRIRHPATITRAAREDANDRPYSRVLARVRAQASEIAPAAAASTSSKAKAIGWSIHTPLKIKPKGRNGFRIPRDVPLNPASLYLTAARPPPDSSPLPHHECSICLNIKSHPVSNPCGHTHCYVCIRICLETGWACPFCRKVITAAPTRNRDSEQAIAFDHPNWHDPSAVTYSWEGLRFPTQ
ncbi:hypothetical protein B0H13DRAFT_2350754 [Mycena leptocephala]|nr:hypothetical protein B0H13DRAFT_2350754 [Mycena leptocephala]